MPLLEPSHAPPYPHEVAKKAATKGNGPWGEAITYWLRERKLRQSHIAEATGLPPNTVSRAAGGLNVQMDKLRLIADFLEVPFEQVLVSPERRLTAEERRQLVQNLAENAMRALDTGEMGRAPQTRRIDPTTLAWAKRLQALKAKLRRSAYGQIVLLEHMQAEQKRKHSRPKRRRDEGE